jgi:hypothetical protein
MDAQTEQITEQRKSTIQDCKNCDQGIAVTSEGLCEVCDTNQNLVGQSASQ